jgi:uncharacterized protein YbaP (TraB family)
MKKVLSLFVLLTGLVFAASAQTTQTAPSAGLLYKISGKNLKQPSYIYGTIHIICQNEMFGMEKLNGYLDQTEKVMLELDLSSPSELQAMAAGLNMPGGKTLKEFLTAEQYAKVDQMFKDNLGASVENFKSYKPFLLNVLIATSPKSLGCTPPGSYDLSFSQTAAAKKKSIEGLETAAEQFAKVDSKPLEKQAQELYEMALDPNKSIDKFKNLLAVYKTQNSDELYKLTDGELGDAQFQKTMLDDRNIAWIPKIEKSIGAQPTFIAVGAAHLGGKNGVVNLLREKGYKVEAINF